jgi:hypothetical protein
MTARSARRFFAVSFFFPLLLVTLVAAQQQPADRAHDWLNGKWRGPAPGGGIIVIDIKVVNGDQITGTSQLESRSSYQPEVSGKVEGDKVTIILTNPRSGNNARFDLTRSGGQLSGSRKGQPVVFEKIP